MASSPPTTDSGYLLGAARALEERLRRCPGVAGLDVRSRLYTLGREGLVRGVRLRRAAEDATHVDVALELVGLQDARLPLAGEAARAEAERVLSERAGRAGDIAVRFTDVASGAVPLQHDPEPEVLLPAATGTPPPSALPAPAEDRSPASGPAGTARVPVADGPGRRTVLLITVEVVTEEAS